MGSVEELDDKISRFLFRATLIIGAGLLIVAQPLIAGPIAIVWIAYRTYHNRIRRGCETQQTRQKAASTTTHRTELLKYVSKTGALAIVCVISTVVCHANPRFADNPHTQALIPFVLLVLSCVTYMWLAFAVYGACLRWIFRVDLFARDISTAVRVLVFAGGIAVFVVGSMTWIVCCTLPTAHIDRDALFESKLRASHRAAELREELPRVTEYFMTLFAAAWALPLVPLGWKTLIQSQKDARQLLAQQRVKSEQAKIAREAQLAREREEAASRDARLREQRESDVRARREYQERQLHGRPAAREAAQLFYADHFELVSKRFPADELRRYLNEEMGDQRSLEEVEAAARRLDEKLKRIIAQEEILQVHSRYAEYIGNGYSEQMLRLYLADPMGDNRPLADVIAAGDRLRSKLQHLYEKSPLRAEREREEWERQRQEAEREEIEQLRNSGWSEEMIAEWLASRRVNRLL